MIRRILTAAAISAVLAAAPARAQDTTVDQTSVSASELIGSTVADSKKQEIGKLSDIILGAGEDNIKAFIVEVQASPDKDPRKMAFAATGLDIYKDPSGELKVYSNVPAEMLENMPAYTKAAFSEDPDGILVK